MNSGSSALISSHGHSLVTTAAASWYQTSRTGSMFTAAQAFVRGDDDLGLAILDAAGERIRREAAEHHRMHCADARAGEHRVGRLRDHRHVDGDPVALLDVAVAQDVGHPADLVVQLPIGDLPVVLRVVTFPDDRGL